jgi:hypothetical protein
MRTFIIITALAASIAALAQTPVPLRVPPISPAVATRIESRFCQWMRQDQFLPFYHRQHDSGSFPVLVEGRLHQGEWEYRALFDRFPAPGFYYYVEWGRRPWQYEEYNSRFTSEGYGILSQQTFQDAARDNIYQTVWVRRDQIPVAKRCLQRVVP